jgi:predicted GH43/DUF377 family glycosyl hydrolase
VRSSVLSVATGLVLLTSGCGRYADFTLPAPESRGPRPPFTWDPQAQPAIARGPTGDSDSVDVLNPSVAFFRGQYWNLYSGFDGRTWHTLAAVSQDGNSWLKTGRVLSPEGWEGSYIAANGSALAVSNAVSNAAGEEMLYWYQAGDPPRIALARSRDGVTWVKNPGPVVPLGPRGSFDERAVADPYVIRAPQRTAEAQFYMFYLGQDRAGRQRLGVARSRDGVTWEKLTANPVLELGEPGAFDEAGLGEPAVWSSGGSWWMWYTGRDRAEHRRIGLARSSDGVHWQRDTTLGPLAGTDPWDSVVLCDPAVYQSNDASIRVWFGGGDKPSPDQNLDGQIGVGVLRGR